MPSDDMNDTVDTVNKSRGIYSFAHKPVAVFYLAHRPLNKITKSKKPSAKSCSPSASQLHIFELLRKCRNFLILPKLLPLDIDVAMDL